jgi:hypothetical protein
MAPKMTRLRALLLTHRRLAAAVLALALVLKVLVPTGFMPGTEDGRLTVRICAEPGSALLVSLPLKPGEHHNDSASADGACPYAALGHATLGGADPLVLALALAFILLLGFAPAPALRLVRWRHRAPPLRGPPLTA